MKVLERVGPYALLRRVDRRGDREAYLALDLRRGALARRSPIVLHRLIVERWDVNLGRHDTEVVLRNEIGADPGLALLREHGEHHGRPYLALEHVPGAGLDRLTADGAPRPAAGIAIVRSLTALFARVEVAAARVHRGTRAYPRSPRLEDVRVDWSGKVVFSGLLESYVDSGPTWVPDQGRLIAPEVLAGRGPDARALVFWLGALLFLFTTGRSPFAKSSGADDRVGFSEIDRAIPKLGAVVARCLRPDPADRPSALLKLGSMLEDFEDAEASPSELAMLARESAAYAEERTLGVELEAVDLRATAGGAAPNDSDPVRPREIGEPELAPLEPPEQLGPYRLLHAWPSSSGLLRALARRQPDARDAARGTAASSHEAGRANAPPHGGPAGSATAPSRANAVILWRTQPRVASPEVVSVFEAEARARERLAPLDVLPPLVDSGITEGVPYLAFEVRPALTIARLVELSAGGLPMPVLAAIAESVVRLFDLLERAEVRIREPVSRQLELGADGTLLYTGPVELDLGTSDGAPESGASRGAAAYPWRAPLARAAALIHALATGAAPREGERVAPRSLRRELPKPLERALIRALSADTADRFSSCAAFAEAIDRAFARRRRASPEELAAWLDDSFRASFCPSLRLIEETRCAVEPPRSPGRAPDQGSDGSPRAEQTRRGSEGPARDEPQPAPVIPIRPPPDPSELAPRDDPEERERELRDDLAELEEITDDLLAIPPPEATFVRPCKAAAGPQMLFVPTSAIGWTASARPLAPFWIDPRLVTEGDYLRFLEATSRPPPIHWDNGRPEQLDKPIVNLTYSEALCYAEWLGKRLPTENEWVCATSGLFGSDGLKDLLHVWEWTSTSYEGGVRAKVVRGGGWRDRRDPAALINRSFVSDRALDVGFRCARSAADGDR